MTIAMFSLIVFSLVMVAAINDNFTAMFLNDKAYAGWDVETEISKENPVDDFEATLEADGVDTEPDRIDRSCRLPEPGCQPVPERRIGVANVRTLGADSKRT